MKLITYKYKNSFDRIGVVYNNHVIDFQQYLKDSNTNVSIPADMLQLLENYEDYYHLLTQVSKSKSQIPIKDVQVLSPLQKPNSLRDAYAFRQHVEVGRKNRGLSMIPEYDLFPVFYYSNHNAIIGGGDLHVQKDHMQKLDFELEIAAIIGKKGKNIKVQNADDYILGYVIMNDFSARKLQMDEMKLNLGPAKGKDFATAVGPYIVTRDELSEYVTENSLGEKFDLSMKAYLNDILVSEDNFKNMTWSFAQIISHISNGTEIFPGDIIGSGTCATGCLLELNLSNKTDIWLKNGDNIRLEVDALGSLENKIVSV